ncbi:MAG: hypothetical protein K6G45_05525 [Lachnospiraceae bacterium]|nr:hypothetical protein [Lachnospiraceae bacterium]
MMKTLKSKVVALILCIMLFFCGCSGQGNSQTYIADNNTVLQKEFEELKRQFDDLKKDYESLKRQNEALKSDYESLKSDYNDIISANEDIHAGSGDINNVTDIPTTDEGNSEIIIADSEYITIKYEKLSADEHNFYLGVYITNKSDQKIRVAVLEPVVNDEMSLMFNAAVIKPLKSSHFDFMAGWDGLSIRSIDDIKSIEFDVLIRNEENWKDMEKIKNVRIDF